MKYFLEYLKEYNEFMYKQKNLALMLDFFVY
jgi:hypothetical protein